MNNAFFFQTKQIPENSTIFDQFKQQKIFFSYFQVEQAAGEQNYYLFLYAQKSIDINFLYQSIDVIQELDSKQRKIRSFRGFFLYALEIMENGKDYEILSTNLQPFFWRKVKNIIRQNQKAALLEFLFGKAELNQDKTLGLIPHLEDQIQTLQNQMDSLQQEISELKHNQTLEIKKTLSELLKRSQASKIDQPEVSYTSSEPSEQDNTTLKSKHSSHSANLLGNESEVNLEIKEPRNEISKTVSKDKITPVTPFSNSQQYNVTSNEEKELHGSNFITLGKISEQEKIEIIKLGFQLQAQGKISLKKYYENTDPNSLFQLKGYSIKYEAIRKNKLYQQLKA